MSNEEFNQLFSELWNSDMSTADIAKELHLTRKYLYVKARTLKDRGYDLVSREVNSGRPKDESIEYDVYRGDEYICSGTATKISKMLNKKRLTVQIWSTPSYHARVKNGYKAYRVNEKEEGFGELQGLCS